MNIYRGVNKSALIAITLLQISCTTYVKLETGDREYGNLQETKEFDIREASGATSASAATAATIYGATAASSCSADNPDCDNGESD